jgi:ferredoxin
VIRLCAWCKVNLDTGETGVNSSGPVTHGICGTCAVNVRKGWGIM